MSTRVGAEGIEARDGEEIVLADEPAAFARAIADLCASPARGKAIAEKARELAARRYDWSAVLLPLVQYYASEGR